jgi:hypothetical protein
MILLEEPAPEREIYPLVKRHTPVNEVSNQEMADRLDQKRGSFIP